MSDEAHLRRVFRAWAEQFCVYQRALPAPASSIGHFNSNNLFICAPLKNLTEVLTVLKDKGVLAENMKLEFDITQHHNPYLG